MGDTTIRGSDSPPPEMPKHSTNVEGAQGKFETVFKKFSDNQIKAEALEEKITKCESKYATRFHEIKGRGLAALAEKVMCFFQEAWFGLCQSSGISNPDVKELSQYREELQGLKAENYNLVTSSIDTAMESFSPKLDVLDPGFKAELKTHLEKELGPLLEKMQLDSKSIIDNVVKKQSREIASKELKHEVLSSYEKGSSTEKERVKKLANFIANSAPHYPSQKSIDSAVKVGLSVIQESIDEATQKYTSAKKEWNDLNAKSDSEITALKNQIKMPKATQDVYAGLDSKGQIKYKKAPPLSKSDIELFEKVKSDPNPSKKDVIHCFRISEYYQKGGKDLYHKPIDVEANTQESYVKERVGMGLLAGVDILKHPGQKFQIINGRATWA